MQTHAPSREMLECIRQCSECSTVCAQTAHHCLHLGGPHADPEHQSLMQDCIELCALAAQFMARSSRHSAAICRECAEVCSACAKDCERVAGKSPEEAMARCIKTCRACAKSCESMSAVNV